MNRKNQPICYVIAEPNGAGKTTFALRYLWIPSAEFSRLRVQQRVEDGGHDISDDAIARRYSRTVSNFLNMFAPLCDEIMCYDNSLPEPWPVFADCEGERTVLDKIRYQSIIKGFHK